VNEHQLPANNQSRFWHNTMVKKYKHMLTYWIYGCLFTISELIIFYLDINLGLFLHISTFISLMVHFYITRKADTSRLYLAISLVPLIRILSLTIPLDGIRLIFWYPVIGLPLLTSAVMVVKLAGFKYHQLGFKINNVYIQLTISLIGLPLGLVGYAILRPASIYRTFSLTEVYLSIIIFILCTGFLEEFIFRGLILHAALRELGNTPSLIYVSFIYAVLQITNGSLLYVIYAFLISILFAKIFLWQRSIFGLSLAHGLYNISLYLISFYIF